MGGYQAGPWKRHFHEAGAQVEEDLQRLVKYLNDEVVPDVRRTGSAALRTAALELHRLAERLDEHGDAKP